MSLIKCSDLPSFDKLHQEGIEFKAYTADSLIKKTSIALLNMMPDAALEATERQFIRLLGKANSAQNICVYPFTLDYTKRSAKAQQHIDTHYLSFDELQKKGVDALIISGANIPLGEMSQAPFWDKLTEIFDWALKHQVHTLFTCLASHCAMEYFYAQKRTLLNEKCWGVFKHQVKHPHPLTHALEQEVSIPHSRMNTVLAQQMIKSDVEILIESKDIGVHMAVSQKHPYFLFFQGHPEYDSVSLLKEYKREIIRFVHGEKESYPPTPTNYLSSSQQNILNDYRASILNSQSKEQQTKLLSQFADQESAIQIDNKWHQPAIQMIENWLQYVT